MIDNSRLHLRLKKGTSAHVDSLPDPASQFSGRKAMLESASTCVAALPRPGQEGMSQKEVGKDERSGNGKRL